jgi:glucokinase
MNMEYSIGVDIGGSHITCALIDLEKNEIIRETLTEMPVDNQGEAHEIIETWSKAIRRSMRNIDSGQIKGIGFAMPGPFDYVNGICLIKGIPKYEKLYGINVGTEISLALGLTEDQSIRFMNDAFSFAVGESIAGQAAGSTKSMAITLGTGFGSAFIDNHVPVVTGDSVPRLGYVYHIKYKDGIADDYFSTRWFIRRYKELTGKDAAGVKSIAAEAIGQENVREIFKEFGSSLGEFLAPILNRFGATVLVLGGNISRAYDLFGPSLESGLQRKNCTSKAYTSLLKEDAALLGSAYLLETEFWDAVKESLRYL